MKAQKMGGLATCAGCALTKRVLRSICRDCGTRAVSSTSSAAVCSEELQMSQAEQEPPRCLLPPQVCMLEPLSVQ